VSKANLTKPDDVRKWIDKVEAEFPVLIQGRWAVSKKYEVLATPFGFLIDEQGIIRSRGLVNSKQQIGYVLEGRGAGTKAEHADASSAGIESREASGSESLSTSTEVAHV